MVWKKITKLKYINGKDIIYLDKIDGMWDALLYCNGEEKDADTIASSKSFIELEQMVKDWIKKNQLRTQIKTSGISGLGFNITKETGVWN